MGMHGSPNSFSDQQRSRPLVEYINIELGKKTGCVREIICSKRSHTALGHTLPSQQDPRQKGKYWCSVAVMKSSTSLTCHRCHEHCERWKQIRRFQDFSCFISLLRSKHKSFAEISKIQRTLFDWKTHVCWIMYGDPCQKQRKRWCSVVKDAAAMVWLKCMELRFSGIAAT